MSTRPAHPLLVLAWLAAAAAPAFAQGIILPTGGPINRSMGGASTAAPLDSIGALYWNPATIAALPSSETGFGLELLWVQRHVTSSIMGVGGTTESDVGSILIPSVGFVQQVPHSRLSFGLGVFCKGGFKTNYPASTGANPIFAPQEAGGLGRSYTQAEFLEIAPAVSIAVTDQLAVGFGPTVTLAEIEAEPFIFAAPDDANGSGVFTYPAARGSRTQWGGGAQAGVYFQYSELLSLGASVKSPQWMEEFSYHSTDELGLPRTVRLALDLPLIVSTGAALYATEDLLLACDVRYIDYASTDGFGGTGFNPDGSLRGLGWSSILAAALGAQYLVCDALALRAGYSFSQNPISDADTSANIGSPLFHQHVVHSGGSLQVADHVLLNLAYSFAFDNDVSGPILTPAGPVPASLVTIGGTAHVFSLGLSSRY